MGSCKLLAGVGGSFPMHFVLLELSRGPFQRYRQNHTSRPREPPFSFLFSSLFFLLLFREVFRSSRISYNFSYRMYRTSFVVFLFIVYRMSVFVSLQFALRFLLFVVVIVALQELLGRRSIGLLSFCRKKVTQRKTASVELTMLYSQ